jgi:HPr kinase/phosphorylase
MLSVKIEELLGERLQGLDLRLIAGKSGLARRVTVPRIQKPGLALAGFTGQVDKGRVQILGASEIGYLAGLDAARASSGMETLLKLEPACLIVTRGLEPPPGLAAKCEQHDIALLGTTLVSSVFIDRVTKILEDKLAPSTSVHGVLLDVLGVGVLLLGKSGIGKSELALDLVMRGHRLVADDIVDIRKRQPDIIFGSGSEIIRHHMEIRGLGIINIKDLFGVSAVRDAKKIELVIELSEWREDEEYDRLGLDDRFYKVLDVEISMLRVPVRSGRSMTSIIEVAARNQLLKVQGHDSAREFQDRLNKAIAEARPSDLTGDEVE